MGIFRQANTPIERLIITLVDDPSIEFVAMFNPEEFQEQLNVNYVEQSIPGLSHQPLQFGSTGNVEFSLTLFFKAETEEELDEIEASRRFLFSLGYPRERPQSTPGAAPPTVLIVWPNVLSVVCKLFSVTGTQQKWRQDGRIIQYAALVTFKQLLEQRMTDADMRRVGMFRGSRR